MISDNTDIVDFLQRHSEASPDKDAFITVGSTVGADGHCTYRELMDRVRERSVLLAALKIRNNRILLPNSDMLDFTISFLACQLIGLVPIPIGSFSGKRHLTVVSGIIANSGAEVVLGPGKLLSEMGQSGIFKGMLVVASDGKVRKDECRSLEKPPERNEMAFVQYTSGSTSQPKGVIVTNKNLLHNQQLIQETFGCNRDSVICSWLPFHHDMGLIGNILHTIYVGCTCVVLTPQHFSQRPVSWLEAITRYQATHSGGPNFAYDLCVDKVLKGDLASLDLSSWRVAYNGSEPVKAKTIDRFAEYFATAGFSQKAFYPCYGLAEATLLVTGSKSESKPVVLAVEVESLSHGKARVLEEGQEGAAVICSSGKIVKGMTVRILAAGGDHWCSDLEVGEICISGNSVTNGYLNGENTDAFISDNGQGFFRTGDQGFLLDGEVFVTGRLKEMIVFRGRNFFPYDIEQQVSEKIPAIRPNGVVLFEGEREGEFVVVAEVRREAYRNGDWNELIGRIHRLVSGLVGIPLSDIVLTIPYGIPRTTSGKLRRLACRGLYERGELKEVSTKLRNVPNKKSVTDLESLSRTAIATAEYSQIREYLLQMIRSKIGDLGSESSGLDKMELAELGIDSLKAVEIINAVNRDLDIQMDPTAIFNSRSLSDLTRTIEHLLWLKANQQPTGNKISI